MENRPDNIYHCCVHKTGSQWIKALLSDEIVLEKTGMSVYTYQKHLPTKGDPRKLTERIFDEPFPKDSIVTPLYLDYHSYTSIPKPVNYKTFCIIRDPRDIIVSWYFSVKDSHPPMGKIPEHRKMLHQLSLRDGLIYCMEYLKDFGLFETLRSWVNAPGAADILLLRFEDIVDVNRQFSIFSRLLAHCRIPLTENEMTGLLDKYRFDRLQKKNKKVSHYRKGTPGDWKNYFDEKLRRQFTKLANDLITQLGYEEE